MKDLLKECQGGGLSASCSLCLLVWFAQVAGKYQLHDFDSDTGRHSIAFFFFFSVNHPRRSYYHTGHAEHFKSVFVCLPQKRNTCNFIL